MRMIYVGCLSTEPDRDSGWIAALGNLGCEVVPFSSRTGHPRAGVADRFARRLHIGRLNRTMQCDLLRLVQQSGPDWVHFRLPVEFDLMTIRQLTSHGIAVTEYFNDDPFSVKAPVGLNWKFRRALPAFDAHFVYRPESVARFKRAGAVEVQHCPPAYDPRRHTQAARLPGEGFLADAAFIGHWDSDWRAACLDALARAGMGTIVRGSGWNGVLREASPETRSPIGPVFGADYNRIYANSLAGLCFFSKLNNDAWTERALEIVAVGGLLVCERTPEALSHFRDREEAFFFSSIAELVEIVARLRGDPAERERVREAGHRRLLAGRHTIDERAAQVLDFVEAKHGARRLSTSQPPPSDAISSRSDVARTSRM